MTMQTWFRNIVATAVVSSALIPMASAQSSYAYRRHQRAKAAQRASDHRHHTGAKIVVGSAAGGALIGGLAGGGKGALIGGALGAGGGAVVNHERVKRDVRQRENGERY